MFSYLKGFSNGKRPEWATLQGVIRKLMSKLGYSVKLMNGMTKGPITRKLIVSINNFKIKNIEFSISCKNVGDTKKEAIKAHGVGIQFQKVKIGYV